MSAVKKRKKTQESSPTDSALLPGRKQWQPTGFCGVCVKPIEALQPGGLDPRHIETQTPLCSEKGSFDSLRDVPEKEN